MGTVSEANTLAAVHPDVAAEWHPTKNGKVTPNDRSRASGKSAWWQCPKNVQHEWEAMIRNRTLQRTGCPECEAEGRSQRQEQFLLDSSLSNIDYDGTFRRSLKSLRTLVAQVVPATVLLKQAFYRMIYASAITALETYLSDAFLQHVIPHRDRMEKLLLTAPELAKEKYSLAEFIDWDRNLKIRVTEYLRDIMWHNLRKVGPMYLDVLGIDFPKSIAHLYRAILLRHDLVHRSGRSKDHKAQRVTSADLQKLFGDVESFVGAIETQLKAM
jgi:hypothetical protein